MMSESPSGFRRPVQLRTSIHDETFAGVTYHIEGELVPALTVEIGDTPIFFEHFVMLWKHPSVRIGILSMKGALRRMLAGMQVFITQAEGPGMMSFSRDGAGQIVPIHLERGQAIEVREHQFLAATSNLDYTFQRVRGVANLLFGGTGFFIDRFHARDRDGIVWLHGYGNVFEKVLAQGESIDIEPGGWVYKDPSVRMETNLQSLSTGLLASLKFTTNRFTGPGRVGIQSMYLHMPTEN